ncbi:pilus assembly protein [Sphingomonas sp. JC676]|uniref:TadE/TadG family type IV pilus assembly protein n=1 Tax=Sphingomonas sp. JC676 TaxID=2768065 RepID=UPI00165816DD|nr:TadE/TadG family type IV pilus assembly protein [Sphingomonas sp. JC676]MBC9031604.1 pilus assembly protein [Sphingomonas sp. JC676]
MTRFALLRRLAREERGAALVEFAVVAPVMGLLLLGAFDVGHTLYMRSVLQGVVQKTARDSTLQDGGTPQEQQMLDDRVRAQTSAIANNAEINITRRFYRTFSEASEAKAEAWSDTNGDGRCDDGEPYEDANQNQVWDADGGNQGQGGAKDAVLYTVTVKYPRMFPLYNLIDGEHTTTISAETVLKNQPFGDQGSYGAPTVRNCP